MTGTFGSFLYKELKIRGFIRDFPIENTPTKNIRTLDNILSEMNVTKCSISDVEIGYPGSILYLEYLLQSNHHINFSICEFFKVWNNREGWQYGCRFDKGKGGRIQVYCYGSLHRCEHQEEYKSSMRALPNGKE